MAKITIAGDAVIVTSALKLEDIRTIEKYRPNALTLMGGEDGKEPIFAIGTADCISSISSVGASFASATHDEAKLATITMCVDVGEDKDADIKEQVADMLGAAIISLNKLEETLPAVLEQIAAEKAAVMGNITVAE